MMKLVSGAGRFLAKISSVFTLVAVIWAVCIIPAAASGIAVLEFELKDLTLNPAIAAEKERVATLRPLLVERLIEHHSLAVVENPESALKEADKGTGYLFERPEIAARIAREAGADWIVTGRLHKASFLFVYLKAQLIDAESGAVSADFVVEIKGPQKKLTVKGVETLAQQIDDAVKVLEKNN
ncbi:MAG: DUF3280 domain-containing protein [Granulosicoccus sp.]|nr:DUF3280 domain-containing protein [Granulosicoccus sp.]